MLVFDDASNAKGHGIGVVITSPIGFIFRSPPNFTLIAQSIWQNMKHAYMVLKKSSI